LLFTINVLLDRAKCNGERRCFCGNTGSSFGNRRRPIVGDIPNYRLIVRILAAKSTAFGVTFSATGAFVIASKAKRSTNNAKELVASSLSGLAPYDPALNPLAFARATRNEDVKPLDLFAAGGEAHLQFKPIVVGGICFGPIERDQGGKFSRQALFDIGRFECRATHGDGAMFGRYGKADRGQRASRAIGAHAGIDADAHLAPGRRFDFAIKRRGLRASHTRRAQHGRCDGPA
jgi:hypothetical protein